MAASRAGLKRKGQRHDEGEARRGLTSKEPPPSLPPAPPKPAYAPTPAEVERVQAQAERSRNRPPAPKVKLKHEPARIEPDHPDRLIWTALLHEACGTAEGTFAQRLFATLSVALQRGRDLLPDEAVMNGALAALHGIAPRDEVEAMLAAQMVATHQTGLDFLGHAARAEQRSARQDCGNLAVKLLRTYALQLEALQRYRGKATEQRVVVEHVHVHAGGQAVVGAVTAAPGGPGASSKVEERAHAQQRQQYLDHAPEPAVRRADAERAPVPVAGGER